MFPDPRIPNGKLIALQSMISAVEFLAELEKKEFLPEELLAGIRHLVLHGQQQMTGAEIAKLLIDEGYLTTALADHLLKELEKHSIAGMPESIKEKAEEEEIGLAQMKEEPQARVIRGSLRTHKLDEDKKEQGPKAPPQEGSKSQQPSKPAISKKTLLDNPSSSPWAASVYERETDSYKGLVSYRLARLSESDEKNPPPPLPESSNRMPTILIIVFAGLALLLVCLIVFFLLR